MPHKGVVHEDHGTQRPSVLPHPDLPRRGVHCLLKVSAHEAPVPEAVRRAVKWGATFCSAAVRRLEAERFKAARVIPSCRAYGSAAYYPLQSSQLLHPY